jgi:hypothetical protein
VKVDVRGMITGALISISLVNRMGLCIGAVACFL